MKPIWTNTIGGAALLVALAGCQHVLATETQAESAATEVAADQLDLLAREYVQLQLAIGQREDGYIDAYYGPPEWAELAKRDTRNLSELRDAVAELSSRISKAVVPVVDAQDMTLRRQTFLLANLRAADTRLRMLQGEKLSFREEALGLFGAAPRLEPLSAYEPVLARVAELVPGDGDLAERVSAMQDRQVIAPEHLQPVFDAAIAACRSRTLAHFDLPADESFTLEFVTGKPWSGYNWYQGGYNSLIQVNTDLPIRISRAVDLGCHEGYPGHHVLNMLLEKNLTIDRGWVEFSVYPLFSPQSLIAEGSANFGIELAFPGERRRAFEAETLYPLAGLNPSEASANSELREALEALSGARFTIAELYLDGKVTREQAVALAQKYQLLSKARAEQSIGFADTYRSYVINYGLGKDMVRDHVFAAGKSAEAQWKAMYKLLSEPTLPSDLNSDRAELAAN